MRYGRGLRLLPAIWRSTATGREAVRAAAQHQPDVAVLDLNMPDGDGLWVCGQLRTGGLATRALILTMYDDDENVLAAATTRRSRIALE
jgi:DNA-binding NarL/FixJ family response regulator